MAINTNYRKISREIEIQNAISERIRTYDCVQKIQHKQYVELKLKTSAFAKMAINTSLRSAALCAP